MKTVVRVFVLFLVLTGAVGLLSGRFGVDFGTADYWDRHGWGFLITIAIFPRLTLLFSSVATGGILWWLGWLFGPHFLVAVLATISYWNANPALVICAWLVALGGESSEKTIMFRRAPARNAWRHANNDERREKWVQAEVEDAPRPPKKD